MDTEDFPQRKHPAHFPPQERNDRAIIVFLTVCTNRRRPLLANAAAHGHLRAVWAGATHWRVGRYVLMPDHLHLFCAPGVWPPEPLTRWVSCWKSRAAATWPPPPIGRLWQRDGWDTQLRAHESYEARWDYVRHNPVRAGLAATPEVWLYQGEMEVLRWHD